MPDINESQVREILSQLLDPPVFRLPPATVGHTRHFMPWKKNWDRLRDGARTMVMNTFVAVPREEKVTLYWPGGHLTSEGERNLRELLSRMNYFGRSESWCSAFLEDSDKAEQEFCNLEEGSNLVAIPSKAPLAKGMANIRVLVPDPNTSMSVTLDCSHPLLITTPKLRDEIRRLDPPGSRWERYVVPEDYLNPMVSVDRKEDTTFVVKVVRYGLDGQVLPQVIDSLRVAELARAAAMSVYGGDSTRRSEVLSGKREDGTPLEEHKHTFYLLTDEDGDCRLDHLTLFSKAGYDLEHQKAFGKLERLYGHSFELDLVLLGMSPSIQEGGADGIFGPGRIWTSFTPYILTRHPKTTKSGQWKMEDIPPNINVGVPEDLGYFPTSDHLLLHYGITPTRDQMQQDGALSQILLSLARRGLPEPTEIQPVAGFRGGTCRYRWLEFKRYRKGGQSPPAGIPYGFRLEFDEPVTGPLAVGFECHFGMGLFLTEG